MISYTNIFQIGTYEFCIYVNESCLVHKVTLSVKTSVQNKDFWVDIFIITQGDYLWNTLVEDPCQGKTIIKMEACVKYLKIEAEKFAKDHPENLVFSTEKKAVKYL